MPRMPAGEQRSGRQEGKNRAPTTAPTFIDAYAGCGGLSLGLLQAGWNGLFAIERDRFAFETLQVNLMNGKRGLKLQWPDWLPKAPLCANSLLQDYSGELAHLRGTVDLIAGGPPCQGFSSAGRRQAADPRNAQVRTYLDLVHALEPKLVMLENVRGITTDFGREQACGGLTNYADFLRNALTPDYHVFRDMVDASAFGVPQARKRFLLVALRRGGAEPACSPLEALAASRSGFLRDKGLLPPVSSAAAISDLEEARNGRMPCCDSAGFEAIAYCGPRTRYQHLMRDGHDGAPPDTRLARHRPDIALRFKQIIATCHADGRLNMSLSREMREALGLKKLALRVLDPDRPSPTVTSMPDDLLHYQEPRTLTVRENARLQSFPDWFEFRGKYTTGGDLRRKEVPRFTQVANAVPPLLAEALGRMLLAWWPGRADRARPSHPAHPS